MARRMDRNDKQDLGTGSGTDDEIVPRKGEQVSQHSAGGEKRDTAGQHGRMAGESAKGLDQENEGSS